MITDPLRRLAYGTDASFYRLVPRVVVVVESEAEVRAVLGACRAQRAPLTFRAAGTSLSGQAISDSVLVVLGVIWLVVAWRRGVGGASWGDRFAERDVVRAELCVAEQPDEAERGERVCEGLCEGCGWAS